MSSKGIAFVVGVIVARMLEPEQFGIIAIANVFISFGQVVLISGFISALVQTKDVSDVEYSSVFYFNILFGITLYILFFFLAVPIANFYKQDILVNVIRVLSLNMLINSLFIVQFAITMKRMEFKRLAVINITTACLAGLGAVIAVYQGFGLWAIVTQALLNSLFLVILFWVLSDWRPIWAFSKTRFLRLYSYAYKMFLNVVMKNVFDNIYNLAIGRYYTMKELGFYSKAHDLQRLPVNTIYQMVSKVSFSYFSNIQDEETKYLKAFTLIFNVLGFINITVMAILIINAYELIALLLTEKWLPSTNLFRLLCCCGVIIPLSNLISNTLEAKGLVSVTLKISLVEKAMMLIGLMLTIKVGISHVIISLFVSLLIAFVIKIVVMTGKLKTTSINLIQKNLTNLFIAIGVSFAAYWVVGQIDSSNYMLIILLRTATFTIGFLMLSFLIRGLPLSISEIKNLTSQFYKR